MPVSVQVLRMPREERAVGEIQRSFICGGGPLGQIAECERAKVFSLDLCSIRISEIYGQYKTIYSVSSRDQLTRNLENFY